MKYFSRFHNRSQNLRPPDLYEYFVDNYWFKSVDLESQKINEPLRGRHKADVVSVGGGYTGLLAAYHIRQKFPDKHIVLLEGPAVGMEPVDAMAVFVLRLICSLKRTHQTLKHCGRT